MCDKLTHNSIRCRLERNENLVEFLIRRIRIQELIMEMRERKAIDGQRYLRWGDEAAGC